MNLPLSWVTVHPDRLDFKWALRGERSLDRDDVQAITPYRGLFAMSFLFRQAFRVVHSSGDLPASLLIAGVDPRAFTEALSAAGYPIETAG
ncbi:MAG: hypothetical protein AAF596_09375 [Planctomycetota bacterium]